MANELRSHSVAAAFDATFAPHFSMKRVPRAKMDAEYSVDAISIIVMKRKHAPPPASNAAAAAAAASVDTAVTAEKAEKGTEKAADEEEEEEVARALAAGLALKEE